MMLPSSTALQRMDAVRSGLVSVDGNKQRLDLGMAFSIEPRAYFAGAYGVRIEDVVVVTEEGAEAMTHAPHGLRSVG